MQKRRKKYFCIQAIPNSENPPYEAALTYSGGLYLDPYFETHSEQDEGYEFLPVLAETYGDGPYTDPNNADGRYLDVVFSKNGPNDYINAHTYLDLEGDTTYSHSKSNDTGVCQSEVSNSVKDNPGNHTIKSNNDLDDDL
ncbi:uncharacterized protein LOC134271075 [Saccostrea cucullata]|uniref:uncharacterized protein LOC134271075 n=1 Tax=Saccostrea cuccullata TaxID=36930 RepID=UPI002ED12BF7